MRRIFAAALFLFASCGQQALAWDPDWDAIDPGTIDHAPDPAPFVVPAGIYLVTDVYAGDVVTTQGETTTYATETVHDMPGTYARVVDVVSTGSSSAFDGTSFNGRTLNGQGQAVGGTYYEDFVLTSSGFLSVNIVFFQDDSETHHAAVPITGPPARPVVDEGPHVTSAPVAAAASFVPQPTASPLNERETTPPAPRISTAGIALGPAAPVLGQIEILRGRRTALWPRVFVDGIQVPVRSWRLISGTVSGTCAGSGTTASCDAQWLTLAPAGSSWRLRFELTADALPGQVLLATLDVTVRSPALEQ